jgi:hypothetical protein
MNNGDMTPTSSKKIDMLGSSAPMNKLKNKLFFKFNQGFTNAVKRPVHISEFLS